MSLLTFCALYEDTFLGIFLQLYTTEDNFLEHSKGQAVYVRAHCRGTLRLASSLYVKYAVLQGLCECKLHTSTQAILLIQSAKLACVAVSGGCSSHRESCRLPENTDHRQ